MAKSITILLYITIFYFNFVSQPEANFTIIECIILVDTFIATHALHEIYYADF